MVKLDLSQHIIEHAILGVRENTKVFGDARYLKLDCSNDPLTANLDINGTLSLNATQVINLATQATFPGTIYYGDGVGASLSHVAGWTGYYNTYVGLSSGNTTTTGYRNVTVGYQALPAVTTGYQNTAIGADTLYANTTGHNNVAIGYAVLDSNTSGHHNIGFGTNTLNDNTTGHYNMGVGQNALGSCTEGNFNVGIGYGAAANITTGDENVAIGRFALFNAAGQSNNVAIGRYAGYRETGSDTFYIDNQDRGSEAAGKTDSLIYGVFNATVASQSLTINAGNVYLPHDNEKLLLGTANDASIYYDGSDMVINPQEVGSGNLKILGDIESEYYLGSVTNTLFGIGGFGNGTLEHTTSRQGWYNTAIGYQAMFYAEAASDNVAIGYRALLDITDGYDSVAIGTQALENMTTGGANFGMGVYSFSSITDETGNVGVGTYTGQKAVGSNNLAIGTSALRYVDAASSNIAIGASALSGYSLELSHPSKNVCIGFEACSLDDALDGAVIAGNVGIGYQSLGGLTTADYNTAVGYQAGKIVSSGVNNVFIGPFVGDITTTGNRNIIIGNTLDASAAGASDELNIGGIIKGSMASGSEYVRFNGDASNYAQFAADGELTLYGTARVNKEFSLLLTDFNPGASGPTKALNDIYPTYEFTIDDDMHTSFEMPTDWAVGTDLTCEVYWAIDEAYATNSGEVRWSADWRAVAVGEVISAGASGTMDFGDVNIPATANTIVKTTSTIAGASLAADDLVAFNCARVALVAGSNPTAEPYIIAVRVEYIADKLGEAR